MVQRSQDIKKCMDRNTAIRMADGSKRKICEIRIGDRVQCGWESARVINIWRGMESKLIQLTAEDGKQIQLTDEHPVLCENGWNI